VITEDFPYTDCIYAVPNTYLLEQGEEILVTVSCNETLSPFYSMSSVSITMPQEAKYVLNSFNVGSPGGAAKEADGLWAQVNPTDFILSNDDLIREQLIGDSRVALEFAIVPIGGTEVSNATGDLFNFKIQPGSGYGFMPTDKVYIGIRRYNDHQISVTHYASAGSFDHFWSHDTNSGVDPVVMAGS
jgi:hypothetical protein